jgi:Holliday junction resolvasome RuvABC endonuclease subunit
MPKNNYDTIVQELADAKWKLLSKSYKNMNTLMSMECPNGHAIEETLKKWRQKQYCPVCSQQQYQHLNIQPIIRKAGVKRVLALDDSTTISGWAIFDDGVLITYGKYEAPSVELVDRIIAIEDWLISMINNWKPNVVAIEDIQMQQNVQLFKSLAKLQGVLEICIIRHKIDYYIVHSQTWKSYCGISGTSRTDQKKSAQMKVIDWYNIKATQDESDAICIGKYVAEKHIKNNAMVDFGQL